jgi:hypothetical protein
MPLSTASTASMNCLYTYSKACALAAVLAADVNDFAVRARVQTLGMGQHTMQRGVHCAAKRCYPVHGHGGTQRHVQH